MLIGVPSTLIQTVLQAYLSSSVECKTPTVTCHPLFPQSSHLVSIQHIWRWCTQIKFKSESSNPVQQSISDPVHNPVQRLDMTLCNGQLYKL